MNWTIWYRIGRSDGTRVIWGPSQHADSDGDWPTAAITNEGYVILAYSDNAFKYDSDLYYRIGKFDPHGDQDQSILWITDRIHWDRGFHGSFAINDSGLVVGVHETGHASTGLYYRVGHLKNPAAGDFTIQWDSGPWGIWYDDGINPHISLNNRNEVVAVHQVPGENLLHYWRGTVSNGRIQFVASQRYNNDALQPAVLLLDSEVVVEAHANGNRSHIIVTSGRLSPSDPGLIEWGSSVGLPGYLGRPSYPALATDGIEVAVTFAEWEGGGYPLRNAVGSICPYAHGDLVKGSSDNVYLVLNDYRHLIPSETTFNALGYTSNNILPLSDHVLNGIPERGPFPSVAPPPGHLRYANGTLVRGTRTNVYVVLNNYRYWIPDEAMFNAMGFKWNSILTLPDFVLNGIPEGTPFPSSTG